MFPKNINHIGLKEAQHVPVKIPCSLQSADTGAKNT